MHPVGYTMEDLRAQAIRVTYETVRHRLPANFTAENVYGALVADGWDIIPLQDGDTVVGSVLVRGNEVHTGFARAGMWSRKALRQHLAPLLAKYGTVTTKVGKENAAGIWFCTRLGFTIAAEEADYFVMNCVECKYV